MSTDFNKNDVNCYKYELKDTDGVIFDLDGTLWDSSYNIAKAWNELLKTRPDIVREDITQEDLYHNMGLPMYDIAANLFPDEEPHVRNALMDDMGIFENKYLLKTGGELFPGVRELIMKTAGKHPVFVVSNCQSGYIEAFIKAHDFEGVFKDHTCWGDTGNGKGDNICLIVERNGLERPVYLGDTASDSKACRQANVPFIYASYGFGDTDEYAAKIENPLDLLSLLDI